MPNYNDRKYRAEEARRQINRMAEGNVNSRTLDQMAKLAMIADALENQNERDEMRGGGYSMEYDNMEMRRGVPGSGRGRTRSAYDEMNEMEMRRGRGRTRSAYDNYDEMDEMEEMRRGGARRRDSRGRFTRSEYDEGMEMRGYPHYVGGYDTGVFPYREYPMMPHMGMEHQQHQRKPQIGFGSGQSMPKSKEDLFSELEEYYIDFKKHQEAAKRTNDPNEKEHAMLELKEFATIMQEIMSKIAKLATTPEEKQHLQQMVSKLQQEVRQ